MIYTRETVLPVGKTTLASDGENLIGLWIEKQKYFADSILNQAREEKDLPVFTQTQKWLDAYFSGKNPRVSDLPLAPCGNAFRQRVWEILRTVPKGQTRTYGDIAKQIAQETGGKMSAQAVGNAVGHNPISIIIPCHRVVGSNGNLTGYAGGLDIKIKLLTLEGVDMSTLFIPKAKRGRLPIL